MAVAVAYKNGYAADMRRRALPSIVLLLIPALSLYAASKQHTVTLGKPNVVKLFVGPNEDKPLDLKVRPLYVDGKLKEFTTGEPHAITENTFVIQRAFRVNDSLPEDPRTLPKWRWQRGGWLLVEKQSGRISKINLPDFDPYYSAAAWYRDYAAYCGTSADGEKLFAVVAQIGVKKPVARQPLGAASVGEMPDSECDVPVWQKQPMRVTFFPKRANKLTFEIHGRAVDLLPIESGGSELSEEGQQQ